MINLMYVVLMAMLAMNISSEVLDGFSIVDDSLVKSTQNAEKQNENIYSAFDQQMKANPAKVQEWYNKAVGIRQMSDSLYNFAQSLKVAIAKEADGEDADVNQIGRASCRERV